VYSVFFGPDAAARTCMHAVRPDRLAGLFVSSPSHSSPRLARPCSRSGGQPRGIYCPKLGGE
jgi:hypothetical protein